jgi:alkanesulfonate monooxygenase SsuD/methylene tetrahydromethanopterin reductase-like flavin-dependent oxidoreductase (luciferase family)
MDFGVFQAYTEIYPEQDGTELYQEQLEQAILADQLGYDYVWLPEHHLVHLLKAPNPLLTAVQVGLQTKNIRVGVAVLILPFRHPLLLAGDIALTDRILNGRFDLGVGRGAYRYEFERLEIEFNESRDRFEECVDILDRVWNSDRAIKYQGKFYHFDDTYVWPRPQQKPHPPMWVAAQTAPTIEWAVEKGYHVLNALQRRPMGVLDLVSEVFHGKREEMGIAQGQLKLGVSRHAFVSDDTKSIERRIEEIQRLHKIHTHMHNFTERADERAYVPPLPVDDLPLESELRDCLLLGNGREVLEKLEAYAAAGVDQLSLWMGFGAPHEEVMESLRLFAKEVMEPFRRQHPSTASMATAKAAH